MAEEEKGGKQEGKETPAGTPAGEVSLEKKAPSAEAQNETAEGAREEEREEFIPRKRFDEVYNKMRMLEAKVALMEQQQATRPSQNPLEPYTDEQLIQAKLIYTDPAQVLAIEKELDRRRMDRTLRLIEAEKIRFGTWMRLLEENPDLKNIESDLYKEASKVFAERPWLKDYPEGEATAVEVALGRMHKKFQAKAKAEGRKEVLETIKAGQAQKTIAGSGESGGRTTPDYTTMSRKDIEAEIQRVKSQPRATIGE